MINELKEVLKAETNDNERIEIIESATRIEDLGYNFLEVVGLLKERGKPIIITKSERDEVLKKIYKDKIGKSFDLISLTDKNKDFQSINDIIMIHKTDFAPKNDRIESRVSSGVLSEYTIEIAGQEYVFHGKPSRNSVHLAANHEVMSNNGGSWTEMKYAVIIPYVDLKAHSKIKCVKAVDTYTEGPVQLTENSYVLCPIGEGAKIQRDNPTITVIEYEGDRVQGYANVLISQLGYKFEPANDHGFNDSKQATRYYKIMEPEGFSFTSHALSDEMEEEEELITVNIMIGLLKMLKEKGIVSKLGKEKLTEVLLKNTIGDSIVSCIRFPEDVYSKLFFDELKEIDIDIDLERIKKKLDEVDTQDSLIQDKIILQDVIDSLGVPVKEGNQFAESLAFLVNKDVLVELNSIDLGTSKPVPIQEEIN